MGMTIDDNDKKASVIQEAKQKVLAEACDSFKKDYKNHLKTAMVAMLTEIQLEFEENTVRWYVGRVDGKSDDVVLMETINDIIQQKIKALEKI